MSKFTYDVHLVENTYYKNSMTVISTRSCKQACEVANSLAIIFGDDDQGLIFSPKVAKELHSICWNNRNKTAYISITRTKI